MAFLGVPPLRGQVLGLWPDRNKDINVLAGLKGIGKLSNHLPISLFVASNSFDVSFFCKRSKCP